MPDYTPTTEQVREFIAAADRVLPSSTPGAAVEAFDRWLAVLEPLDQVKHLIRDLTDPDDCEFDHHGGCQAHGYLSLQPGELCPHAEAKQLIAGWLPAPDTTNREIRADDEPNCCGAGEWVCSSTCSAPKWTALEEATNHESEG